MQNRNSGQGRCLRTKGDTVPHHFGYVCFFCACVREGKHVNTTLCGNIHLVQ